MRLTIVPDDSLVVINGVGRVLVGATFPAGVRAVQWSGAGGEVEYSAAEGEPRPLNQAITDLAQFQDLIDAWHAAAPPPPPPPPDPAALVPAMVSRFQLQEALRDTASPIPELPSAFEAVDAAVTSIGGRALRAWQGAMVFERSSPTVAELADAFGWSSEQVDDLFRAAAAISA